jgi:hypothetical protein
MSIHNIDREVKELLMQQENVLLTAKQVKGVPGGSFSTPHSIHITNMRVIFKNPKLFGLKANIVDVNYKDISNVRLKHGMLSTEIYLDIKGNKAEEISLPAVDKQIAQNVVNLIQKGIQGELPHQSKTERNRQGQSDHNHNITEEKEELYSNLEKRTVQKQMGALSDSEFKMLKDDILKKMPGANLSSDFDNLHNPTPIDNDSVAGHKTCPNFKCKSENEVTSLSCRYCGTKLNQ